MDMLPTDGKYVLGFGYGSAYCGDFTYYADSITQALNERGEKVNNDRDEVCGVYSSGKLFFAYDYNCIEVPEEDGSNYVELEVKNCTGYINLSDMTVNFFRFTTGRKKYDYNDLVRVVNLGNYIAFYRDEYFIDVVDCATCNLESYSTSVYDDYEFFSNSAIFYNDTEILAVEDGSVTTVLYPEEAEQISDLSHGWLLYKKAVADGVQLAAINIYTGAYADSEQVMQFNEAYGYFDDYFGQYQIGDGVYKTYNTNLNIRIMDKNDETVAEITPEYMRQNSKEFAYTEKLFMREIDFNNVFVQDKIVYFSASKWTQFGRFKLDATYTICFRWDMQSVPQYIGYTPEFASLKFVIPV